MSLESIIKQITGTIRLKGATDGTKIGNVGDALKVSSAQSDDDKADQITTMYTIDDVVIELKKLNKAISLTLLNNDEIEEEDV